MSLRNTIPMKFSPVSASDAIDSTDVFTGAMASLSNLVPDPGTKNLWEARPASIMQTGFPGFTAPGFISGLEIVGSKAYGLIASGRNAGKDEPFCYDLVMGGFVTVSGITAANTPASPPSAGDWVPPSLDTIGTKIIVCHPGFNGAGNGYIGWFDISDPAHPAWSSGNITGLITFTTPPNFVINFNGRAYYLVNPPIGQPSAVFSDVLVPLNATNANQALTFDDNTPLTAIGALPLANQLGGIIQAIIVFKGVSNMYQITGDAALGNLAKNSLNLATGTLAPLSVCSTPKGLAFMSPDGMRIINEDAQVGDPLGYSGMGIVKPFINALHPSRVAAGCNANVMRVSVQNGGAAGSPFQDWWYHFSSGGIWSGPHTFPAALIEPYENTFIITGQGVNAALWQGDVAQNALSQFNENGTVLTWTYQTSLLPDTDQMCENAMLETTLYMALVSSSGQIVVTAIDQDNTILGEATISLSVQSSLWGQFNWGQGTWGAAIKSLFPQRLAWHAPVVFRRMSIVATGTSALDYRIGRLHLSYEKLGYLQDIPGASFHDRFTLDKSQLGGPDVLG